MDNKIKNESSTNQKKLTQAKEKSLREKKVDYAINHRPLSFLRKSLQEEKYYLSRL